MQRVIPDVFDDLEIGITLHDPETGEILGVNERLEQLYGYTATQLREMDVGEYSAGAFTTAQAAERIRAAADGEPQTFEWHVERADGDRVWVRVRLAATTLDGESYVIAEIRDITDRKQREQELREERAFIDSTIEAIPDVFYTFDEYSQFQVWNERLVEVTGYTDDEITEMTPQEFFPDDEQATITDAVGKIIETEESQRVESAFRTKDGKRIPYEFSGGPLYDAEGNLDGIAGIGRDITERKAREQELALKNQAIEEAPLGITLTDAQKEDNPLIYANQAFADLVGYSHEEMAGWNHRQLHGPATSEAAKAQFRRAIEAEEPTTVELRNYRQDGTPFWNSVTIAPLYDETGTLTNWVGFQEDVTDRKEREQQLTQLHDATQRLVAAETRAEVADIASETARDVLEFGINSIHFHDEGAGGLAPAAVSERARELLGEPPVLDSGLAWEAFTQGETRIEDDLRAATEVYNPDTDLGSEMYLPLGEHGVCIIASTEVGAFDDTDLTLAKILTANVETTLDRMAQEQQYRRLTERISSGYYAFDSDWTVTYWNDTIAQRQAMPAEEILGQHFWDVYPEIEDTEYGETLRKAMDTGEPQSIEYYYEPDDYWVKSQMFPDAEGLVVLSTDITERKEDQKELERSNERLEQFAYVASHDLQEPLRTIANYIELIAEEYGDQLDEEAQGFIDTVVTSSERMQSMLNGLLDYSRVTTRGEEFEPVDTENVVRDIVADLQFLLDEHDGTVEWDGLPTVTADGAQLRQVFQNLVKNALEHADESVTVEISATETDDHYRFVVADDGPGIAQNRQEKIFRIFNSSEQDQTSGQARGIGLAICENIVSRHGGEIHVDSEPGEGATFVFTIEKVE